MSRSLKKALALVDLVADGAHTLQDLSIMSGLPKSTVHRLATALMETGYLSQMHHGYRLGNRLLILGSVAREQNPISAVAIPHMEAMSAVTGETVHLGELQGTDVVYLAKVNGSRGLQMQSRVGLVSPAQNTAMGKAIVAWEPEERWRTFFAYLPARTTRTITTSEAFMEELREARLRGVAFDREENELGICCVAAPIFDADARVVAAVSLSSAAVYLPGDRLERLGREVMATAKAISQTLGWRAGTL